MRKSRFLMNLIAATAIGLSVFGCDSSDSGAIGDTTDIIGANDPGAQTRNLREYLIVGQRGLNPAPIAAVPDEDNGQTLPTPPTGSGPIIAVGTGDANVPRALLYEAFGINNTPEPNFNFTGPGGDSTDPNTPTVGGGADNEGTTGYHGVYVDPTQKFVIGVSRAKNRGVQGDTEIVNSQMQIFSLQIEEPIEEVFPPNVIFGDVFDPVPIFSFSPDQGEFVSGAWSPDARFFYLGIQGGIVTWSIDGNFGRLEDEQVIDFPDGPPGDFNNPALLIPSADGAFLFAVDNANSQIISYSKDPATGFLSQIDVEPTVVDPRGATIERSGQFMYVVGRSSALLAGYRIESDGTLTPIEVFAGLGPTATPLTGAPPLGDVAHNPQFDGLYVGTYLGVVQPYNIDTATGQLSVAGEAERLLSGDRNIANLEVEPTGRFVVSVQEHDYDELQPYVTAANGFPIPEDNIFANLVAPNSGEEAFSDAVQTDLNGNPVFILPAALGGEVQPQTTGGAVFAGSVQALRIQADGTVRAERRVGAENPYGLSFFQLVVPAPAGTTGDGGGGGGGTP